VHNLLSMLLQQPYPMWQNYEIFYKFRSDCYRN